MIYLTLILNIRPVPVVRGGWSRGMWAKHRMWLAVAAAAIVLGGAVVWLLPRGEGSSVEQLVLYSGRSRSLVQPMIRQFEQETGIRVRVRYGESSQLATTLREEGRRSPADVFWSQDAGTLGALVRAERFEALPESLVADVPMVYRSADRYWVGTSGRARVLAYSPERVSSEELPTSVFDLADRRYRGRVAWAPTNASFQAFVLAMRRVHGDDVARQWLTDLRANGARAYANNTAIVQGIAAGEVDFGLTNHYYLLRFRDTHADYPVEQTAFEAGDVANLVLTSGAGVLAGARNREAAERFVAFLLSQSTQRYFVTETFEYPVVDGVELPSDGPIDPARQRELAPVMELDALDDLEGTLRLFREVGLL
ncbi:iron ABC transporter substrate-binding protein [Phycisphaerales bacterium AB-hyl4]|uniref:Iron ABC transporter substrate-binding protein n=1 Tax=Natronomicrosphaera hydrolytica TaxID=3242702 RepID=A0ABV4UA79_9BACT